MKFSFRTNAIKIDIIKNILVALLVVKKLPVLLIGNISDKNKKINGVIMWLFAKDEIVKYFLINVIYKIFIKIDDIIIKPNNPVSVIISK